MEGGSKLNIYVTHLFELVILMPIKARLTLILILLSTLLVAKAYATEIPSYNIADNQQLQEQFELAYIQAPRKEMLPADIAKLKPKYSIRSSRFYIPSVDADHWFIVRVENNSDSYIERMLRIDEGYFSEASLFFLRNDQWNTELNGLQIPLEDRKVKSLHPSFLIELAPFETKVIYLKLNSHYYNLTAGIHIEPMAQFYKKEQANLLIYAAYLGAALTILIYNLFLYLSIKEKLYLYYFYQGISFFVFVFLYSNFDLYLGTSETIHYMATTSIALAMAFLIIFAREMLDTRSNMPKVDILLLLCSSLFFLIALLILLDVRNHRFLLMLVMPTSVLLLAVGVKALTQKVVLSKFYLIGSSWHLIGLFTITAVNTGFISYSPFMRHAYLAGSLIELTLFSFALAYKIKVLQETKLSKQQQQVHSEHENSQHLRQLIDNQAIALSRANQHLDRLSAKDNVTFLNSRQHFDQHLSTLWQEGDSICLLFCDINHFTNYNQSYGYPAGDQCLIQVADVIESVVTDLIPFSEARLCSRFAGGKFAVILPQLSIDKASFIANEISDRLVELALPDYSGSAHISLCFGYAQMTPFADKTPQDLVKQADIDLLRNKVTQSNVAEKKNSSAPYHVGSTSISHG
ncbi:diguanylate cyclase (GGDEF) domain-containing protein [Oceanospirillum multiglobuliferum]|uniref:diguanylate cyclase n=2 Tax=Oceanospirillum multiglobuliferum TaxID=64969 RepID=A0A1T4RRT3_9GAMM|nr:hypothetical protein BTE48_13070 [Oceanospirillum multiglobuliferum]SKA18674.1 diguanylate cyclase (GGDEF) domain-containing protein [Oceanospirillum multiglobuliferum]